MCLSQALSSRIVVNNHFVLGYVFIRAFSQYWCGQKGTTIYIFFVQSYHTVANTIILLHSLLAIHSFRCLIIASTKTVIFLAHFLASDNKLFNYYLEYLQTA